MTRIFLAFSTIFFTLICFSQNSPVEFIKEFNEHQINNSAEKIFVHSDKELYGPGETIWFKVYQVNSITHSPDIRSTVVFVSLLSPSGEVISQRTVNTKTGFGAGNIELPSDLVGGNYTLFAYTRLMLELEPSFTFEKKIRVLGDSDNESSIIVESRIDVQFFPEGGELVAGILNYVGFKVSKSDGTSAEVNGLIINEKNDTITDFRTVKHGLGEFPLIPEKGALYRGIIEFENSLYHFPLPTAKENGHVLQVKSRNEKLDILIANNQGVTAENLFLLGHIRGFVFCAVQGKSDKKFLSLSIPYKKIPSGIAHFTLFENNLPIAERLAFIENPNDELPLDISMNKNVFKQRDSVSISLKIMRDSSSFNAANVSISIFAPASEQIQSIGNIQSYLWLESDLQGEIENADYYFNPLNENRLKHLDLLLMTQGWRRFKWEDISDKSSLTEFTPQNGFRISGQLVNPDNPSKPIIGQVSLNKWDNILDMVETETDSLGRFSFEKLEIFDTTWLILQASKIGRRKTKKLSEEAYISILLDEPEEFIKPEMDTIEVIEKFSRKKNMLSENISLPGFEGLEEKYMEQWKKIMKVDSVYNTNISIQLDEIQITSQREKRSDPLNRGSLHGEPSKRLVMDSLSANLGGQTIFSIISGRFAGVRVVGQPPDQQVIIQGLGSTSNSLPLYILDGIYVTSQTISRVIATDVSHIEILKGPDAAIYGSDGSNGVLAVYTRDGFTIGPSRVNVKRIPFKGYDIPREFYTPNYKVSNPDHAKPDFRTTLYWNNEVILTPEEIKNLSFYTSDDSKKYIMKVQGISYNGLPIFSESTITIE